MRNSLACRAVVERLVRVALPHLLAGAHACMHSGAHGLYLVKPFGQMHVIFLCSRICKYKNSSNAMADHADGLVLCHIHPAMV